MVRLGGNLASDCGLPCGVLVPVESLRSDAAAHARNTVSRIEGVKRDSVRCDSVSAARRSIFFCEKEACISVGVSSEKEVSSISSKPLPLAGC